MCECKLKHDYTAFKFLLAGIWNKKLDEMGDFTDWYNVNKEKDSTFGLLCLAIYGCIENRVKKMLNRSSESKKSGDG